GATARGAAEGRPRAPEVARRGLRLRGPAQALALRRGDDRGPIPGPAAEALPRRVPLVPAHARGDRRAPAAPADRARNGAQSPPGARVGRGRGQGDPAGAALTRGDVAPGAEAVPRREADALPAPPLVRAGEEAACVGRRGGAGGDVAAL